MRSQTDSMNPEVRKSVHNKQNTPNTTEARTPAAGEAATAAGASLSKKSKSAIFASAKNKNAQLKEKDTLGSHGF